MKILAAIEADLQTTPLGTRSRLGDELLERAVLARTVERVLRASEPAAVFVVCPHAQAEGCRQILGERNVRYWTHSGQPPPYRQLIQTARKWSLDGWRGGLGGSCAMDEYTDCGVLAALAKSESADGVLAIPAAAAVIDPAMIDGMCQQFARVSSEVRMAFCQAPPGLVGTVFAPSILEELAAKRLPPGWVLSYKPDAPMIDLTSKPCCYQTSQAVRHAAGRLIADTDAGVACLTDLLAAHPDPDAEAIGRFLIERDRTHVPSLPREIEIELTTDDPYPDTPLRPRGARVGRRGSMEVDMVRRVARELTGESIRNRDDILVLLGGFGDPLLHPELGEVLSILRKAGVFGLAIRTTGVGLTAPVRALLIEHGVDVLEVLLDAWTPQLYEGVTRGAGPAPAAGMSLGDVAAQIDALMRERAARQSVRPIVVPTLTKARQTVREMDAFFDGWVRKAGCANIVGFNHYSGRLEDHSVIDMCPPHRTPCRRIMNRCTILADGRITVCDQDYRGEHTIGCVTERPLRELWQADLMQTVRNQHLARDFAATRFCAGCTEWHRP
ncbi:MAG TPA: SPASM domain-containing protein [Phycisphaerae bacterium]